MTLQTSGAISFNDLHVEAGGTSGTQVSLNDADIIKMSHPHNPHPAGSERRMNQFYGQQLTLNVPIVLIGQVSGRQDSWVEFKSIQVTATEAAFNPAPDTEDPPSPNKYINFEYNLNSLVGRTGWLMFVYQNGDTSVTGGAAYQGDIQIDKVIVSGIEGTSSTDTTYTWETGNENWQTHKRTSALSGSLDIYSNLPNYPFSNVGTTTGTYEWNRDSGGTGSSGTGRTDAADGSYYMYAETSGSSTSNSYYLLRSPQLTFGNGTPSTNPNHNGEGTGQINVKFSVARLGSNVGTLQLYFVEAGAGSSNYTKDAPNEITIVPDARTVSSKSGLNSWTFQRGATNFDEFFQLLFDDVSLSQNKTEYPWRITIDAYPTDITSTDGADAFMRFYYVTNPGTQASTTYSLYGRSVRFKPWYYMRLYYQNKFLTEFNMNGASLGDSTGLLYVRSPWVFHQDNWPTGTAATSDFKLVLGY